MANIVNFTDKQFENRLNDNLEELVQVKKRFQPLQTVDKTLLVSTPEAFFLFWVQKVCT